MHKSKLARLVARPARSDAPGGLPPKPSPRAMPKPLSATNAWRTLRLERGLERCRAGEWELGVEDLMAVSQEGRRKDLPSLLYSYLGYALARSHGDVKRGLRFCRRAVRMEFYQPENYLNLARTELLANNRRAAHHAVLRGLDFDPSHAALIELRDDLGSRRDPVIRFLGRRNLLNRLLGRIRHDLTRRPTRPSATPT